MTTPLERITSRIAPFLADGVCHPKPLLTLEEFFDGNDVAGSILCNVTILTDGVPDSPTPQQVRDVLATIRSRRDVDDVRVAVAMFDDPDWPFAEEVLVVTDAPADEVRTWLPEAMAPDEVLVPGHLDGFEPIDLQGRRPVICWWD